MLRITRLVLPLIVTGSALAPPASADRSFGLGPGQDPSVTVEPSTGVAHITWVDGAADKLRYCRLPRDAAACAVQRELPGTFPAGTSGGTDEAADPSIFRDPGNGDLVIVAAQYIADEVFLFRSADNGDTWSGPTTIYASGLHDGGVQTDMIVDPTTREVVIAKFNVHHRVAGVKLDGSEASTTAFAELDVAGHAINYHADVAQAPTGELVIVGNTLEGDNDAYAWTAGAGADPSTTASWSATPTLVGPGEFPAVAGGPSGVFGAFIASQAGGALTVRKWAGGARFADGVLVGNGDRPDIAVGASGAVGVAWRKGTDSLYSISRNGGASFSAPARIAADLPADQRLALAADGKGVTVYGGVGSPPSIHVATTDPIPVPPPKKLVETKEGRYTISGVPRCVREGMTFTVTLGFKRAKRKGNVVVKVRKTVFSYQGNPVRTAKRAPFRATFKVLRAKAGKLYVMRARAFLKVRRGKERKRSITSSTKVC
jgi:hypothetical protein